MARVRLVHWGAQEARERARLLRASGHIVSLKPLDAAGMKALIEKPPDAVIVDLSRQPSRGRDTGIWLRNRKATRQVPLLFAGGDDELVARVKGVLPDATYAPWKIIRSALRAALARPPGNPARPDAMAGYSGTPLPKKLGVKAGTKLVLLGAPDDFEKTLGVLPDGVRIARRARGKCDLIVWFSRSRKDVERRIAGMRPKIGAGGIWIAWQKQASGVASDLTQNEVRRIGLANGLVDYKIAAFDATWSGLRFAVRK